MDMTIPGVPGGVEGIGGAGAAPAGGEHAGQPLENDVDRFDAAMAGGGSGTPDAGVVSATGEAGGVDRAVEALGSVSRDYHNAAGEVADILSNQDMSRADILRAQISLSKAQVMVNAAAKVSEKVSAAVKTLQQGS